MSQSTVEKDIDRTIAELQFESQRAVAEGRKSVEGKRKIAAIAAQVSEKLGIRSILTNRGIYYISESQEERIGA